MKTRLFVFLSMLFPVLIFAQTGKVYDNLSMKSEILKMDRKYAIYLPPDYETSERSYPVLYLLHGAGDDQTGWVQFGEVLRITDNAIKEGKATPMIIVMPDGNTGQRGYFNNLKGDWRYEDFFFEELMPYVEKNISDKRRKTLSRHCRIIDGWRRNFYVCITSPRIILIGMPVKCCMWSVKYG